MSFLSLTEDQKLLVANHMRERKKPYTVLVKNCFESTMELARFDTQLEASNFACRLCELGVIAESSSVVEWEAYLKALPRL